MPVVIRRAERQDAETVLDLLTSLAKFESLTPPDAEGRERFVHDGWGDTPRFQAWLAEIDGEPAGYALTFFTYSTFLCRPTLYLEDLFVLPDCRRSGIGYALFHHLANHAVEQGCGRMEWACLDWNTGAQDFYTGLGARHMSEWYYYRLLPEQIRELPAPEA